MPTLDMTLFDWTDYEDMKPADTWPSNKRKGMKAHSQGLNSYFIVHQMDSSSFPTVGFVLILGVLRPIYIQ